VGANRLGYPVVHTLNDENSVLILKITRAKANALNSPPGTMVARLKLKEIDEVRTSGGTCV
jgi:hypothetical protein